MIIVPKVRGFVCVTTHPTGCARNVDEQIAHVRGQGKIAGGPRSVLVAGASTGYGLASRVTAAFGCGASTVGVFLERPPAPKRPATAGWYNSAAVERAAREAGLRARSVNGDAFSDAVKQRTVELLKDGFGPVDLVVYSLAAPKRSHPRTGETAKSVLKPIGAVYEGKTLDTDKAEVKPVTIEPASEQEIAETTSVMGGEDWEAWIDSLDAAGLLAEGCRSVAYTYIGPRLTWPIYWEGTIGRAKDHLDRTAAALDARLRPRGGGAVVSVMKAVVTQASSAIPVVPLYMSILFKEMKAKGIHEGTIEQIQRMFATRVYGPEGIVVDESGRVRMDDWEMRPEVQDAVNAVWPRVSTENLRELTDFEGYQREFLRLFGFGLEGVDYDADVDPEVPIEGLLQVG
jgi:enoyl-[acyl-carrier protein] reductase/trans-2-enoyl-CoA reductase (NAD+)